MKPRNWAAKALQSRIFRGRVTPNKRRAVRNGYARHRNRQD
jgi:hypothetical protein